MECIRVIIFDWGDTLMRDLPEYNGPMVDWPIVKLIPGVTESLKELSNRFICCAASNAGDSNAELMGRAFRRVGIRKYFKHLFTSKELGFAKPDIGFFREIIRRLNIKPEESIMIGNDYLKDIVPAKSIGMQTILFSEIPVTEQKPYADAVITSMRYLVDTIINNSYRYKP